MKKVLIESPFKGKTLKEEADNIEYAKACLLDSLNRGEAPYASHLLYPQVLDDNKPIERAKGIEAGLIWGKGALMSAIYIDRGITEGMIQGIHRAGRDGRPCYWRSLYGKEPTETEVELLQSTWKKGRSKK